MNTSMRHQHASFTSGPWVPCKEWLWFLLPQFPHMTGKLPLSDKHTGQNLSLVASFLSWEGRIWCQSERRSWKPMLQCVFVLSCLEVGACSLAQASLTCVAIFLPLPLQCQYDKPEPPCLAGKVFVTAEPVFSPSSSKYSVQLRGSLMEVH